MATLKKELPMKLTISVECTLEELEGIFGKELKEITPQQTRLYLVQKLANLSLIKSIQGGNFLSSSELSYLNFTNKQLTQDIGTGEWRVRNEAIYDLTDMD